MRWPRAIIERRSDGLRVDGRAVVAWTVLGVAVAGLLRWLLPDDWFYGVVVLLALITLAIEIWVGRRRARRSAGSGRGHTRA